MELFENEIAKYLKNKTTVKNVFAHPEILPKKKGIYIYTVPDTNAIIEFADTTTAKETHKSRNLLYSAEELTKKFNNGDNKTLYIGSTPDGTIYDRTSLRAKYSKEKFKSIRARGGRALWQIKNWENIGLNFYYYEIEDCETLETYLLSLYKQQYGVYPVANWRK